MITPKHMSYLIAKTRNEKAFTSRGFLRPGLRTRETPQQSFCRIGRLADPAKRQGRLCRMLAGKRNSAVHSETMRIYNGYVICFAVS